MLERRPLFGLLIGLTVCVSIWRISLQEASMVATETNYINQFQSQISHQQQISSKSPGKNSGDGTQWRNNVRNGNTNRNSLNIVISNFNLSLVSLPTSVINYDLLPKDDLSSLIDLHDFEFIMNQIPCDGSSKSPIANDATSPHSSSIGDSFSSSESKQTIPLVIILVHSAPANYKKRQLIRETWGSSMNDRSTRLIFLLGAVSAIEDQELLDMENSMFADMVQGNFIDSYRNMTYKHVMALKWFSYYCPDVKYILKIDDDIFVNTPFLLKYLNSTAERQNLLFCQKLSGSRPKRSYRSKWRVSVREYPGRYYPPYCPGYAIIYSPDVAFRLYREAQKTPYFWIDDVHLTGTLSQQANITISTFAPFLLHKYESEQIVAGKTDINSSVFLFTSPSVQENYTRSLWNLIRNDR